MVACLALATATRASVLPFVTNTTSGVGLLADGFENQTLGAGFPTTALMSPFVTGSSWWTGSSDSNKMFTTTEQAYLSSQSLKLTRTAGTFTRLDGLYTTQTNGTLDLKLMVYVPSVTNPLPSILLFSEIGRAHV